MPFPDPPIEPVPSLGPLPIPARVAVVG